MSRTFRSCKRRLRPLARVILPIALGFLGFEFIGSAYLAWTTTLGPKGMTPHARQWMTLCNWGMCASWILAPISIYLLRPRPIPPHHCRLCGYSLAGLAADAPCPECGNPHAQNQPGTK